MTRSVLHDAIALVQMDLLSVVQFQRHLEANHDPVIDGIRGVHARCVALEWSPISGTFSDAARKLQPG